MISVNKPDLVLFVGEALVGNEAVDQLKQFNRALRDHHEGGGAASDTPIDGILLTKFDTIDDKVTIATVVSNNFTHTTTGGGSHINDIYNRTANHIHRYWSNI